MLCFVMSEKDSFGPVLEVLEMRRGFIGPNEGGTTSSPEVVDGHFSGVQQERLLQCS